MHLGLAGNEVDHASARGFTVRAQAPDVSQLAMEEAPFTVPLVLIDQAKNMVTHIINTLKQALKSASWISSSIRSDAINTLDYLKTYLSLSRQQETLNDLVDSENIADLVGTMIAYAAFASLSPQHKNETLAGLSMSSEQLFFINHCVKWCSQYRTSGRRYAPYRSRCIVPLMNMPEFSRAFGCATGTPMNPQEKCTFW
ncbi:neprilysin-4-like [Rhipicephalus sanguineus]|uniref:neprilysin-4-like n=1 Tax=Rhipicephalus sanguineus TaxID=34632 RepID=UPI0020C33153|nr:neprilysin-4-like [Rhipicephalus sanguineus]